MEIPEDVRRENFLDDEGGTWMLYWRNEQLLTVEHKIRNGVTVYWNRAEWDEESWILYRSIGLGRMEKFTLDNDGREGWNVRTYYNDTRFEYDNWGLLAWYHLVQAIITSP